MTCNWKVRLLIAMTLVVAWATSAEACHRRRACAPVAYTCAYSGYGYASSTGYYSAGVGYVTDGGGYYGGRYAGTYGGYGWRGYNPGGLGGPWSGLGVRPGLGFGGLGRGR